MKKRKYYYALAGSVLLLFVLFLFVISAPTLPNQVNLSPGEESSYSPNPLIGGAAFVMGILIVFISAILVLIGVG